MNSASSLEINFLAGKLQYRRQHTSLRKEALARALGLKNNSQPKIIDATAGLGQDSYILASLGFEVQMLERSKLVFQALQNAMQQALLDETNAPIIQRMHLIHADSITWLANLTKTHQRPELIYLDPMFPERKKSALTKKAMRLFHEIVGDDLDADNLLTTALACATQRVVVKRPRLAETLGGLKPSFSLMGKSNRFDVYLL